MKNFNVNMAIKTAVYQVLRHPNLAKKDFLINAKDKMLVRDQYIGRYQIPVADCVLTMADLFVNTGEVIGQNEDFLSAKFSVAKAIINILGAKIDNFSDINLLVNEKNKEKLTEIEKICKKLNIKFENNNTFEKSIISAVAPVSDVKKMITPELINADSALYRLDLSKGKLRLGGSIFAEIFNKSDNDTPNLDDENDLIHFFNFLQAGNKKGLISAYHTLGKGGLLVTVAEMQFTARMAINLTLTDKDVLEQLFAEELGAVIQVLPENVAELMALAEEYQVSELLSLIGQTIETPIGGANQDNLTIITPNNTLSEHGENILRFSRAELQQAWSMVNYQFAKEHFNSECMQQEFELIANPNHHGLIAQAHYDLNQKIELPYINARIQAEVDMPKVAIFQNNQNNSQSAMISGFSHVGFEVENLQLDDLINGQVHLRDFNGLVVSEDLGADSILADDNLRMQFVQFFHRPETFSLAVADGCQMMAQLKDLMPNAQHFPCFLANKSARFEERIVNVRIENTKSVLLKGMQGSILPVGVAYGEGLADLTHDEVQNMAQHGHLALRYVDSQGSPTEVYPLNPSGSIAGVTGITSNDGRITLMMTNPESGLRAVQHSYKPNEWQEDGAWLRMFRNAMAFLR